jgi:peptidoglycan/LPS O-acetylase OafA/YrhL
LTPAQQQDTGPRLHYVPGLDGLRAIAVAAVVIFHATESWLRGGFLGVDVFFVLSGFLITSQLLREWGQGRQIDVRAFWRRRARRILAALYLLLAVTLAFALVFRPEEVAVFRGDAVAALAYVANWYYIFHNQPYFETVAHPSPLIHLWSLGVEEQFYLVWPLLLAACLFFLRRWAALLVLLLAAASAVEMALLYQPAVDPSRLYYGTDTHASGLLLGSLLAFFWRPQNRGIANHDASGLVGRVSAYAHRSLAIDVVALVALALLGYFFVQANDSQPFLYRGGFTLIALITAVGVVAVSHPAAGLLTALLELAPVRWLGRRSYSVYLWHWPVIVFTRPGVDVRISGYPLLALRIGLALVLAELSFRYIEEPVRRGALIRIWKRLQEARQTRQWGRVLASGLAGIVAVSMLLGICIAAAQAKTPAPPSYLAETSVDTIVRPSKQAAPAIAAATAPVAAAMQAAATATGPSPTVVAAAPTAILSSAADSGPAPATTLSSANAAGPAASGVAIPDPPSTPVSAGSVVAIGDSVMLGAVPQLASAIDGIQVDAAVSRQVSAGVTLLQQLRSEGVLGNVVVVGLGSNGTFTSGEFDQIMSVLTAVPRVVFINNKVPRSWEESNNAVITNGVQRYPSTRLVDWYDASVNHPEFFYSDEYHLQPAGASAYSSLVAAALSGP